MNNRTKDIIGAEAVDEPRVQNSAYQVPAHGPVKVFTPEEIAAYVKSMQN